MSWKKRDPCRSLEKFLIEEKIIDKNALADMNHSILIEIEKAFESAQKDNFPGPDEICQGLFKEKGQKICPG